MGIGKKEKTAIFDWLLQKHGMQRRLVRIKIKDRRIWQLCAVPKNLGNRMHIFVACREDRELVGIGIDNPCYGKHKILDSLLKWSRTYGDIYLSWRGTDLFIKKDETLESLMMQYELENSHWQ